MPSAWPVLPPLVHHRPQGHDERSTTFARLPPSPQATSGTPADACNPSCCAVASITSTGHRRTAAPLHHRPRARRRPAHRLQDPPRLPVPALRRGLPGRHLPAHPRRADRRQGHPRHRRHVIRASSPPSPHPPSARSTPSVNETARSLACHPRRGSPICPHGRSQSCGQRHGRDDPLLGEPLCPDCYDYTGSVLFNACAPELWRRFTITLRRSLARQAGLTSKALAAPAPRLLRQGRRIPAPRRRPLPRHHPARRPRRTQHRPARLGHPRTAHRRHRPGRQSRPHRNPRRPRPARPHPGLGARARHPAHHQHRGPDRHQGRRLRRQVRHQGRRMHRHPRPPHHPGRPARRPVPSASTPAAIIAECLRLGKLPALDGLRLAAWAHMLGFCGHFSTKSRAYSTTLSALRADRASTSARPPSPPDSGPTSTATRSSFSPTGASPDADRARPAVRPWPPRVPGGPGRRRARGGDVQDRV